MDNSSKCCCLNWSELRYTLCNSKFGYIVLATDLIDQCSERWKTDLEKISEVNGNDIKDVVLEHPYLEEILF